MYVEKISLLNYRNFDMLEIDLDKGVNIFYGDNAQGKTNFLEAIYFSGTGRSHRTNFDKDLIKFDQSEGHIKAIINNDDIKDKIDIHLRSNGKKGIAINSLPIKSLGDLFGMLLIVIFSPEDLNLVKAGPTVRRRFLDMELCQLNKVYYYNLRQYYKILRQRNALLKKIKNDKKLIDTLEIWDEQLVEYGIKIMEIRKEFLLKLDYIAKNIYGKITSGKEVLKISYKQNISIDNFKSKLKSNWERDIYIGSTSIGIHKDDIIFYVNNNDVRVFGSQGQQRTTALTVKLAEVEIIKEEKNQLPVLLLDDVLSELDIHRQKFLIESLKDIQTVITCTGVEDILNIISDRSQIYNVHDGKIKRVEK